MVETVCLRTALWAGFAVAGALSVAAALIGADDAALHGGCIAFAALAGLAASDPHAVPPRVRWSLAGAMVILCLACAAELVWQPPLPASGDVMRRPAAMSGALIEYLGALVDTKRSVAVMTLVAMLLLGVAVRAVPRVDGLVPALLVGALALVPVATNIGELLDSDTIGAFVAQVGAVWSGLAGLGAAVVLAVSAGRRADRSRLLPVGALLLVVTAAVALDDLGDQWSMWYAIARPESAVFFGTAAATEGDATDPWAAAATAIALCAPALLTHSVLRASLPAES